jgi:hypothetical protein
MSITPVGGWGKREDLNSTEELILSSNHRPSACPACGSAEWKSASLIHAEGLATTKSRTKGTALGVGRAGLSHGKFLVGGGTYSSRTRGASQTLLSSMANPPRKRNGLIFFLIIVCLLVGCRAASEFQLNGLTSSALILGVITVVLLFSIFSVWSRQQEAYREAVETYSDTRMCQRCGTFYGA